MLWSSIFVTFVAKKIHWIVVWILPESPGKEYSSNPFEHCIALGDSSLIESFLRIIFIQINQLTLQSVEISLHGGVIIGTSCFTHALCHMNRFAKFYECFGSIMQIYDCTVVAYFMIFQKQIGKIGTPFLIDFICCIFFSNTLCGLPCSYSGVFGSCSKHLDRY